MSVLGLGRPSATSRVFGVMAAYAWRTLAPGRELARRIPDEDKPWA